MDSKKHMSEPVVRWSLDRDASVLAEQRARGPHQHDFFSRYEAVAIADDAHAPLEVLKSFTRDGAAIFYLTPDKREVVVDARFSTTLEVVDATSLGEGRTAKLGELLDRSLKGLTVLELLVRADAIRTYAHMGSEVRVERAETSGASFDALVRGEHVYFTSRQHRASFAFRFRVEANGDLHVTGLSSCVNLGNESL